nr:uncharacterized protein LOC104120139 [Nicotiana tomentosiformis]
MEGISMNPGFSDHYPLSVGFDITNQAGMRPFKFLNCLASLSEFDATVKQIWRSNKRGPAMLSVWNKLKTLKGALKQLNKQAFRGIWSKIQATKGRLETIQDKMNIPGQDAETVALEKATKQARNSIGRLITSTGQILQNPTEVEEEILSFYRGLLGTAATQLSAVNPQIIQNGHILNRRQQLQLIRPVTKEEVKQATMDIETTRHRGIVIGLSGAISPTGATGGSGATARAGALPAPRGLLLPLA